MNKSDNDNYENNSTDNPKTNSEDNPINSEQFQYQQNGQQPEKPQGESPQQPGQPQGQFPQQPGQPQEQQPYQQPGQPQGQFPQQPGQSQEQQPYQQPGQPQGQFPQQPGQPQGQFPQQPGQQYYGPSPTLNVNPYFWKSIRHDNMILICLLVVFFFLNSIAQTVIMFIQIAIGGGFEKILQDILISGTDYSQVYSQTMSQVGELLNNIPGGIGISLIIGEALALLIFLTIRGKRLFTSDIVYTRNKITFPRLLAFFIIAFGAEFVFSILSMLMDLLLGNFGMSSTSMMGEMISYLESPSGILYMVIFGPIMEEIVFRGAILRTLQKHGENYAIVMSSLFFGMFHIILIQGTFAFFVGLILGYVAIRYSMKWSIVLHIMINGIAILIGTIIPVTGQMIVFGVFFVGAVILLVKGKSIIAEQKIEGKPVLNDAYKIAFSGGFLIAALAVVFILGFLMM